MSAAEVEGQLAAPAVAGELLRPVLVKVAGAGLALGTALWLAGRGSAEDAVWIAASLPVLAALVWEFVTSLRRLAHGLDITAALSMMGALVVGEALTAALMYSGGQRLEACTERPARREMTAHFGRDRAARAQRRQVARRQLDADHRGRVSNAVGCFGERSDGHDHQ